MLTAILFTQCTCGINLLINEWIKHFHIRRYFKKIMENEIKRPKGGGKKAPSTWETWMKLLAPDFSLGQSPRLHLSGERISRWKAFVTLFLPLFV